MEEASGAQQGDGDDQLADRLLRSMGPAWGVPPPVRLGVSPQKVRPLPHCCCCLRETCRQPCCGVVSCTGLRPLPQAERAQGGGAGDRASSLVGAVQRKRRHRRVMFPLRPILRRTQVTTSTIRTNLKSCPHYVKPDTNRVARGQQEDAPHA
jgi:hypothetical protein